MPITHEDQTKVAVADLNSRYLAAWSEVNTRITLRQNALTQYIGLSGLIISIMLSTAFIQGQAADGGILFALIPIFSVGFAFLNYKHDKTIALLRNFLGRCEQSPLRFEPSERYPALNRMATTAEISLECRRIELGICTTGHSQSRYSYSMYLGFLGGGRSSLHQSGLIFISVVCTS
jgi:hypothetical protein